MHMPVFLMGLICGPMFGLLGGILIPVMSCILTGMPAVYPMLPIMVGELGMYGSVSGILHHKFRQDLYVSLIGSMICGKGVYAVLFQILLLLNHGELKALSVSAAFITGLPGIIIQLLCIPLIVRAVEHSLVEIGGIRMAIDKTDDFRESVEMGHKEEKKAGKEEGETAAMREALSLIHSGSATCVLIQDGKIVHQASGKGIQPLVDVYDEKTDLLKDAIAVDKIIGKAAAMFLVLGEVKQAYAEVISASGKQYLEKNHVSVTYGRCVEIISNRTGSGICPLEETVMEIENPAEGILKLKETIKKMRNAG
ncbi:MAG: DUF1893 domain-containing protein [Lachnospiraceae bacterium]|nr:DUF1893 domain-containing protein [Lachnospiraceae bacterium]